MAMNDFDQGSRFAAKLRTQVWSQALKEWNMGESTVANGWRMEGRVEDRADSVLDVLQTRFGQLPVDLINQIRAVKDLTILKSWLSLAVKVNDVNEFVKPLCLDHGPPKKPKARGPNKFFRGATVRKPLIISTTCQIVERV